MVRAKLLSTKWVAVLAGLVLADVAAAQAQQSAGNAVISVTSKPSGISVILSGDYTVAGITPTTFTQKLEGFYRITAHRDGYETYHSSIILSGREATSIDIVMTPRTRVKAALRSLVFPGWGQMYYGARAKGVALMLGVVGAGVTTGLLHLHFDDRRDDYDEILTRFQRTRSVTDQEKMLDELYRKQKDAYDAERNRNIGIGVVAGIWVYGILDAFLFFPDYGISISGASLSLQPDVRGEGVRIVGTVKF